MKILAIFMLFITTTFAQSINWIHSLPRAIELAQNEHKNIMVFIDANGCPFCEKMKNETLSDKDVARNLNKDFVNVELKIDSKDVKENFPSVSMTPTIYFITPKKELLHTVVGFQTLEFFFWDLGDVDRALEKLKKGK